ncbi:MAG: polyprenyl synthetase family protein [Bacillota bacterium]
MPYGMSTRGLIHVLFLRNAFERRFLQMECQWPKHKQLVSCAIQGGHRTRPIATLLASEAVGGSWQDAIPLAMAIELAHKASVIRDDIADGDDHRSGRYTFHTVHGIPSAIAISDLLWSTSLTQLSQAPERSPVREKCLPLFISTYHTMALGQVEDLHPDMITETNLLPDYLEINRRKTGSLAELAFRCGAIAGGGTKEHVGSLAHYGRNIGLAFQILNDVHNLTGRETKQGRNMATDLRDGKCTALVAYAMNTAPSSVKDKLKELLSKGAQLSKKETQEMAEIMLSLGSHTYGESLATTLLDEGKSHLRELPSTVAREILHDVSNIAQLRRFAF